MTNATLGARSESDLSPEQERSLRYAMLSVYFRTIGGQLETRGAPVVAVTPDVEPLTLEVALARLEPWPARLWDAYWRIVRAVPVEEWQDRELGRRYPRTFVERLGRETVEELDDLRRRARANAHLLTAALLACADDDLDEARALADLLETKARADEQLAEATESVLGQTPHELVRSLASDERRPRTKLELDRLQADVGLNLNDFVEDFLDTVAFAHFKENQDPKPPETVLASSCIVRQDTNTLTTTATVTTLVDTEFDVLKKQIDPLGWPACSDVIEHTGYLEDPFDVDSEIPDLPIGETLPEGRLLFERVGVHWGLDEVQTGEFRNVLAIDKFSVNEDRKTITLLFRLYRSIDSRILWDERAGGILIDGGYILVRPVGDDRSRVTSRKVLKFSDRTPYSNAPGWLDFGEMLNYLAPASVAWWLETELGSADCTRYRRDDPRVADEDEDKKARCCDGR
jgi:hypothetical protein